MKRFYSLLVLALCSLILSSTVFASSDGVIRPTPPPDIFLKPGATAPPAKMSQTISSWAQKDVEWMISKNIVPADLQGNYQSNITRVEFATLMINSLTYLATSMKKDYWAYSENRFTDTSNADVYKAYSIGILNGETSSVFAPNQYIDREEAAMMLANFLRTVRAKNLSTSGMKYVDQLSISKWAQDSVNITGNAGIFKGTGEGFRPFDYYTREQAIVTSKRLIDYVGSVSGFSFRGKVYVKFSDLDRTDKVGEDKDQGYMKPIVGLNYVRFGEPKYASAELKDYLGRLSTDISSSAASKLLKGDTPVEDGNFTWQIKGKGSMIRVSWK